MLFLFTLIGLKTFDGTDHDTPNEVKGLVSWYVSWKPEKSLNLFGKNSQYQINPAENFSDYADQLVNFIIGEAYGCIPITIIAIIAIICAIVVTSLCACSCVPHRSTSPGLCSIIAYVIFSLIFALSLIYYCFNIYYTICFSKFYKH